MAGLGMTALATQQLLAACGIKPTDSTGRDISQMKATQTPDLSTEPSTNEMEPTQSPTGEAPGLVVVHGTNPESMIRKGMQAIGGLERFVKSGANVIIKPNICAGYRTYKYAVTTDPWLVGALVKLCFEAGAGRVRVMDNPFGGTAQECYANSGIAEQVANAGGEMEVMQHLKFKDTSCPNGVAQSSFKLYEEFLTADTIINVPIAKDHSAATLTLGMKNLMGTVNGREQLHSSLHESIVDLATLVRPTVTVMDAIRILLANGPTGGSLDDVKETNTIAISPDIVTVDSWATSLFNMSPSDVGYVRKAIDRNLGVGDLSQVKLEEINADA